MDQLHAIQWREQIQRAEDLVSPLKCIVEALHAKFMCIFVANYWLMSVDLKLSRRVGTAVSAYGGGGKAAMYCYDCVTSGHIMGLGRGLNSVCPTVWEGWEALQGSLCVRNIFFKRLLLWTAVHTVIMGTLISILFQCNDLSGSTNLHLSILLN